MGQFGTWHCYLDDCMRLYPPPLFHRRRNNKGVELLQRWMWGSVKLTAELVEYSECSNVSNMSSSAEEEGAREHTPCVMTIKTLVYFGLPVRRRRMGRCLPFRALMEDTMTDYIACWVVPESNTMVSLRYE